MWMNLNLSIRKEIPDQVRDDVGGGRDDVKELRMNIRIIYLIVLMAVVGACDYAGADMPVQYGEISVSLTDGPSVEVASKAGSDAVLATDCKVSIINKAGGVSPVEFMYESPVAHKLPFGTYYVTAENCTEAEAEAGNGRKRVAGRSADVTLDADNLEHEVSFECEIVNTMVTVVFDESTQGRFSDGLNVYLANSAGRLLTLPQTAADIETVTWFNPTGDFYCTISGRYEYNGILNNVSYSETMALAAKENIRIVVRIDSQNGQLWPVVDFDVNIDESEPQEPGFNPYN